MNQVLFVDDESLILNSLKRGLIDEPYRQFFASSGEQALRILEAEEVSVLVTDMRMPGMSGLDLLKIVKEKNPDVVKIVLSGFTQLAQVLVTVNQGDIFKFITKPWDLEGEFKAAIREAVDYYNYKMELKKAQNVLEKKNVTFQNILKSYDDKVIAIKDEISLIRDLNELFFREMNSSLRAWDYKNRSMEDLVEGMKLSQLTLIEAFNQVPSINRRFTYKQLVDDTRAWMIQQSTLRHIEFGIDSKTKTTFKGRYDLLWFVVRSLLRACFEDNFETQISMVVSGANLTDEETLVKVVLSCDEKYIVSGESVNLVLEILSQIVRAMGGELVVRDLPGSKAFVINMICVR